MELAGNGWQVTVEGKVVRLDDLPLAAWERVTEASGKEWPDCYYKPLADLQITRLLFGEACATIGVDPAPILDTITVPKLVAMFDVLTDDLPTEVTDGTPREGVDSLTAG